MIQLKSQISRSRIARTQVWQVNTFAMDTDDGHYIMGATDMATSFREAFEVAAEQREAIDGMLMDSVFRDRMVRRDVHTMEATA